MSPEPHFLDLHEITMIHEHQIEVYGGMPGIRDLGMLESALAMPSASFGDEYYHKDLFEMAAAYLFHLAQDHPYIDGNKRIAAAAAFHFLDMNGVLVDAPNVAFRDLVFGVASGKVLKPAIAAFFRKHAVK